MLSKVVVFSLIGEYHCHFTDIFQSHEKRIQYQECPNKHDIVDYLRTKFDRIVDEVLNRGYLVFEKEDGKKE